MWPEDPPRPTVGVGDEEPWRTMAEWFYHLPNLWVFLPIATTYTAMHCDTAGDRIHVLVLTSDAGN